MSSSGTGADISPQDANDILRKFISESIKVQVAFSSGAVSAFVAGFVTLAPDGRLSVFERNEVGTPLVIFDPSLAVSRKYGDTRAFPKNLLNAPVPGAPRLASALSFVFPDTSQLTLFEIAETP